MGTLCIIFILSFLFSKLGGGFFFHIIPRRRKEIAAAVGDFISPVTVQKTEFVN